MPSLPPSPNHSEERQSLEGVWHKDAPQQWEKSLTHATHLLCETARSDGDCLDALTQSFPRLTEHIRALQRYPKAMSVWGKSQNWDENAKAQIVEPAILNALGRLAGIKMQEGDLHAGLLHTYGYLFSLLDTPFGYKRDRWLHEAMGERFGLPEDTFSPLPQAGSLLLNLTFFLGSLVFSAQSNQWRILKRLRGHLSPSLARYPFQRLPHWRITETLSFSKSFLTNQLYIHTDIVRPPHPPPNDGQLLIYSLAAQAHRPMLVTAFFTSPNYVETLLRQPQGQDIEIALRYNAFFKGLDNTPRIGTRTIRPM